MNTEMHRINSFLLAVLALVSCVKPESESRDDNQDNEINITVTSLTATIAGSFLDLSIEDQQYGTFGILYGLKRDNPEQEFYSWRKGNRDNKCEIYRGGHLKGSQYQGKIDGLLPDQEYMCCLYFESEDKSRREIGAISSFRTMAFNPMPKVNDVLNIKHYTLELSGIISLNEDDLKLCTVGVLISDTSDVELQSSRVMTTRNEEITKEGTFNIPVNNLRAGHDYWCRAFVKINNTEDYAFGPLDKITTMQPDDMAVDLGLSVKWADRDLGSDDLNERAPCYAWGHFVSYGTYFTLDVNKYKYWDTSNNCYMDIGDDISGTEYDVATYLLGGKWRMPTKKEVEELLTCKIETIWKEGYMVGFKFHGSNGNSIYMPQELRWTSTLSDYVDVVRVNNNTVTYDCVYPNPWLFNSYDGIEFFGDFNKKYYRFRECVIRPVCDY
jgi:hypothetical protein